MRDALRKVAFGPASWLLLLYALAQVALLMQRWVDTGQAPGVDDWWAMVPVLALAVLRTAQAMVQEYVAARWGERPPVDAPPADPPADGGEPGGGMLSRLLRGR